MQPSFWDISMPLQPWLSTWRDSSGFKLRKVQAIAAGGTVDQARAEAAPACAVMLRPMSAEVAT